MLKLDQHRHHRPEAAVKQNSTNPDEALLGLLQDSLAEKALRFPVPCVNFCELSHSVA
jgi:hypothetical protein